MSQEFLFQVLRSPHVSEKSTRIGEQGNQYVFEIDKRATKTQVKEAVESLFNVKVENVNVVNVKGKVRSFRMRPGRRADWKKAYVRIQEGQTIDVLSISESA